MAPKAEPPPPPPAPPGPSAAHLRAEMLARPANSIPDNLSPTNSRLLDLALADYLPPEARPPQPQQLKGGSRHGGGCPLPQGHHLVYFPPQMRESELLPDGTDPAHWPGGPFRRRMWAGGSVSFAPGWARSMRLGGGGVDGPGAPPVVCWEDVVDVQVRHGARGGTGGADDKVFVELRRRYGLDDGGGGFVPSIEERRTLVFLRDVPAPAVVAEERPVASGPSTPGEEEEEGAAASAASRQPRSRRVVRAPHPATYSFSLVPTQRLLFHFSALTYNAHSIHLDPAFCRQVEGHRGLLVHGPLSLTLMFAALRGAARLEQQQQQQEEGVEGGEGIDALVKRIDYRNLAPLYAGEEMRVCVRRIGGGDGGVDAGGERKWDVWIEGPDGGLAVRGAAVG